MPITSFTVPLPSHRGARERITARQGSRGATTSAPGGLGHALGQLWPSYAAYAVSFLTIGTIWVNHHSAFRLIDHTDRRLLFLNLGLLLTVSFIPFPTSVLARYLGTGPDQHVAALTYSGTMALQGIAFAATALYAIRAGLTPRGDS